MAPVSVQVTPGVFLDLSFRRKRRHESYVSYQVYLGDENIGFVQQSGSWSSDSSWSAFSDYGLDQELKDPMRCVEGFHTRLAAGIYILRHHGYLNERFNYEGGPVARNIAAKQDHVYRAVTKVRRWFRGVLQDEVHTDYEGAYNTPGAAKARVSFWRGHLKEGFVDGWVEESDPITWHRYEPVSENDSLAKG